MQYRQLGTSDITISAITFGAWAIGGWMWGGADSDDAVKAIETAIDSGITSIDTAPVYGFGLSEELVGKAIRGKRDKVQVLTKYGLRWDIQEGEFFFATEDQEGKPLKIHKNARKKDIVQECEQSLRRLGVEYIDLFQNHWRDHTTPLDETMEAMDILVKEGKIRAAGVSNYTIDEIATSRDLHPIASVQPPFSMVKRDSEKEIIPFCQKNDIGVVVYSPLQRGLLTGKITPDYTFNEGDNRKTSEEFAKANIARVNDLLKKLQPIASSHNATLAQLVINWTVHRPGITAALVGARNPQQVKENAGSLAFTLTDEVRNKIDTLVAEHGY
jgi:aryl-alcohol dehydrogenase-like predicted oxidoreductase